MPVGPAQGLITRCPRCATAFRASSEQLDARGGQVRCGRCGQVFDARACMVELPGPMLEEPRIDVPEPAEMEPLYDSTSFMAEPLPDEARPRAEPGHQAALEPQVEPGPEVGPSLQVEPELQAEGGEHSSVLPPAWESAEAPLPHIELVEPETAPLSHTDLEAPPPAAGEDSRPEETAVGEDGVHPVLGSGEQTVFEAAAALEADAPVVETEPAVVEEAASQDALPDEIASHELPSGVAPPDESMRDEPIAAQEPQGEELLVEAAGDEPLIEVAADEPLVEVAADEPLVEVAADEPLVEVAADEPPRAPIKPERVARPGRSLRADEPPLDFGRRKPAGSRPALSLWESVPAAVLLLLLLAGQLLYSQRASLLVLFPAARPAAEKFCGSLHCDLPYPRRAELMSIESSNLQADTANPAAMVLSATLRNRAPFPQAQPMLELTLTDSQDQALARRVLGPADYGAPQSRFFPAASELPVKLYFDASAVKATGYRLYLFYP